MIGLVRRPLAKRFGGRIVLFVGKGLIGLGGGSQCWPGRHDEGTLGALTSRTACSGPGPRVWHTRTMSKGLVVSAVTGRGSKGTGRGQGGNESPTSDTIRGGFRSAQAVLGEHSSRQAPAGADCRRGARDIPK